MPANSPTLCLPSDEGQNAITVRFPAGTSLTEANAELLQRELFTIIGDRTNLHLTIDLSGITILTSVILGKFIAANKQVRSEGGNMTLLNPTPTVRMVFAVSRLDTVLDVKP